MARDLCSKGVMRNIDIPHNVDKREIPTNNVSPFPTINRHKINVILIFKH